MMKQTSAPTETSNKISLKGSVEMVTEFFDYAINSILYQRGVYAPETFKRLNKYGLTLFLSTDESLLKYMTAVRSQLTSFLGEHHLQKVVCVISSVATQTVLERWAFDIESTDKSADNSENNPANNATTGGNKTAKQVHDEIAAIMRQVAASVTYLPMLSEACSFEVLAYTDESTAIPAAMQESDAKEIAGAQHVKFRSFSTNHHNVDTMVAYKTPDIF